MTKYTFLFVALLLILLPFFGLKEVKEEAQSQSSSEPVSQPSTDDK